MISLTGSGTNALGSSVESAEAKEPESSGRSHVRNHNGQKYKYSSDGQRDRGHKMSNHSHYSDRKATQTKSVSQRKREADSKINENQENKDAIGLPCVERSLGRNDRRHGETERRLVTESNKTHCDTVEVESVGATHEMNHNALGTRNPTASNAANNGANRHCIAYSEHNSHRCPNKDTDRRSYADRGRQYTNQRSAGRYEPGDRYHSERHHKNAAARHDHRDEDAGVSRFSDGRVKPSHGSSKSRYAECKRQDDACEKAGADDVVTGHCSSSESKGRRQPGNVGATDGGNGVEMKFSDDVEVESCRLDSASSRETSNAGRSSRGNRSEYRASTCPESVRSTRTRHRASDGIKTPAAVVTDSAVNVQEELEEQSARTSSVGGEERQGSSTSGCGGSWRTDGGRRMHDRDHRNSGRGGRFSERPRGGGVRRSTGKQEFVDEGVENVPDGAESISSERSEFQRPINSRNRQSVNHRKFENSNNPRRSHRGSYGNGYGYERGHFRVKPKISDNSGSCSDKTSISAQRPADPPEAISLASVSLTDTVDNRSCPPGFRVHVSASTSSSNVPAS